MAKKVPSLAVIGATGMVGRELIRILEERQFKFSKLKLFASKKSAGELINFGDDQISVEALEHADQVDTDIAFFAAGSEVSRRFIEKIAALGVICIDKSSYLRLDPQIPLVVNEVNASLALGAQIIASPNCVATPLVQALAPIEKLAGLKSLTLCSYQAVSGAGQAGSDELESQVRALFNMREFTTHVFGERIAFNVLPAIPAKKAFDTMGKSEEEHKLIEETKKILELPDLKMDATCVRVPVFNGHSLAVHLETKNAFKFEDALERLSTAPGIILIDDPKKTKYPTPLDACGNDLTLVGRVRPNTAVAHGLCLWITSDNLRTGAALNAVRIAETITME